MRFDVCGAPARLANQWRRTLVLCISSLAAALLGLGVGDASAQPGILTRELLVKYTPDWTGERFPDGRPKVPDGIVERMKNVTLE